MRTYKRKSTRGTYSRGTLEAAAASVVFGGLSIRKSATEYGVNYKTLRRYITKYKNNQFSLQGVPIGYVINSQVLTKDMVQNVADYVKKAAQIYHGITITDLRRLAYRMAKTTLLKRVLTQMMNAILSLSSVRFRAGTLALAFIQTLVHKYSQKSKE